MSVEGRHDLLGEQADGLIRRLRRDVAEQVAGAEDVVTDEVVLFLTETGFAGGAARTRIDPWGDFSAGRWTGLLRTSLRLSVEPELPAHILLTGE